LHNNNETDFLNKKKSEIEHRMVQFSSLDLREKNKSIFFIYIVKDNCTAKISYSFKSKAILYNESDGTP
jgi:hypothetical protein